MRPWVLGSLAVTSLVLLSGLMGAGDEITVGGDSTSVAVPPFGPPPVPGPVSLPVPPPPPGPDAIAAPLPDAALVATRADGPGEVFALPLGQPALLRDETAGTVVEVRATAAWRPAGVLLVDVQVAQAAEWESEPAGISATGIDALVLRLPDGRELQPLVRGADGSGLPATLAPRQRWEGVLEFADPGRDGALVLLHAGRALASWTIPAR